jgi:hypothetical protein
MLDFRPIFCCIHAWILYFQAPWISTTFLRVRLEGESTCRFANIVPAGVGVSSLAVRRTLIPTIFACSIELTPAIVFRSSGYPVGTGRIVPVFTHSPCTICDAVPLTAPITVRVSDEELCDSDIRVGGPLFAELGTVLADARVLVGRTFTAVKVFAGAGSSASLHHVLVCFCDGAKSLSVVSVPSTGLNTFHDGGHDYSPDDADADMEDGHGDVVGFDYAGFPAEAGLPAGSMVYYNSGGGDTFFTSFACLEPMGNVSAFIPFHAQLDSGGEHRGGTEVALLTRVAPRTTLCASLGELRPKSSPNIVHVNLDDCSGALFLLLLWSCPSLFSRQRGVVQSRMHPPFCGVVVVVQRMPALVLSYLWAHQSARCNVSAWRLRQSLWWTPKSHTALHGDSLPSQPTAPCVLTLSPLLPSIRPLWNSPSYEHFVWLLRKDARLPLRFHACVCRPAVVSLPFRQLAVFYSALKTGLTYTDALSSGLTALTRLWKGSQPLSVLPALLRRHDYFEVGSCGAFGSLYPWFWCDCPFLVWGLQTSGDKPGVGPTGKPLRPLKAGREDKKKPSLIDNDVSAVNSTTHGDLTAIRRRTDSGQEEGTVEPPAADYVGVVVNKEELERKKAAKREKKLAKEAHKTLEANLGFDSPVDREACDAPRLELVRAASDSITAAVMEDVRRMWGMGDDANPDRVRAFADGRTSAQESKDPPPAELVIDCINKELEKAGFVSKMTRRERDVAHSVFDSSKK